ncbi:MAG: hypothetical protein QOJ50_3417 [Cryptosporangiaceae bacterium]|jgi:tetratricopeptide (TPR) repeat protein|nr:hypothetical protein [Cryptosporangiaceae bacterium]
MPEQGALHLAEHWLSVGQPDRALDALTRLHGPEALTGQAYMVRLTALHDLGRHDEVEVAGESAIERIGPVPHLLAMIGSSRRSLGRLDAAERAYLQGLAEDPHDVLLLCWYARLCLEVGQDTKAEKLVERAASRDPDSSLVLSARALIAYVRGQDAEMLRATREGLRNDPDDAGAHYLYGMAAANRGQLGAAARSLGRAAAENPGDRDLVETAREVRTEAHPLLRPLWPIHRFGALPVWLGAVVVFMGLRAAGARGPATIVGLVWGVYCVYSWVMPPIVRRLRRRLR